MSDSRGAELAPADLELLRARAQRYAARVDAGIDGDRTEVVVFTRGSARCAIALDALCEIRALRHLCRIPGARPAVPGVFHARGEILSAHDVGALLGGPPAVDAAWVVLVERDDERIGLLADEIVGVERASRSALHPIPLTLGEAATCFEGVLEDGVLLLDAARLFSTPAFHEAF